MSVLPFAKRFRLRMANWKSGGRNQDARSNKAAPIFLFCAFMAMRIERIAGLPWRPRCGMIAQWKSGE